MKFTVPTDIPVTNPELLTVAIAVLPLTQVPPVVGVKVVVLPAQIDEMPELLTIGNAFTVSATAGEEVTVVGAQLPVTTTEKFAPFSVIEGLVIVNIEVVTLLYGAVLVSATPFLSH